MENIKSRFFDSVDKNSPLPEYPRPQLVREEWMSLNGQWDYAITSKNSGTPLQYSGKITVPFAPECSLSGVERHVTKDELLWYRRGFTVPEAWSGKRIILHFGAVDWLCQVYINGKEAVSHRGGYNPFSVDISQYLEDGENEIVVRVYDPTDNGSQARGKQADKTHGFWYTATTGIWQTVWLEPVSDCYIKGIKVTPDIDIDAVNIKTDIYNIPGCTCETVITFDGEEVFKGETGADTTITVNGAKLWTPETPNLYGLTIRLLKNGEVADTVSSYFGMRKFSITKDADGTPRICLNNKPYFQRGLLDQGYWPDGGLTPPSDEAMIYDIEKMKDLGFNMLRKHIKVEPARWYWHCDRLGMLVWQDMPSGGGYVGPIYAGALPNIGIRSIPDNRNYARFKREDKTSREDYRRELFEMIDALYNTVSICVWVTFNESWGQFDARDIGWKTKEYDPSRLVDHASGWYDEGGPDFVSIHKYIMPVTAPKKDPSRPFVLSEYGGYSQNIKGHVWNEKKSFGYQMYRSGKTLTKAFVKLHEKQIIPLIKKGLCATVYTQVSDVEWEVNGLLTYDRQLDKIDADAVRAVNAKLTY